MGDLSNEPSMEEILSSIKRIIAEEGDAAPGRARRTGRTMPAASVDGDEVLELSDPIPAERPAADRAMSERVLADRIAVAERPRAERAAPVARADDDGYDDAEEVAVVEKTGRATARQAEPRSPAPEPRAMAAEPMVSAGTVEATRGALDNLSRMFVKPEPGTDGTLEGLVREMLRPMIREWLDANLPGIAEDMVAREIGRITSGRR